MRSGGRCTRVRFLILTGCLATKGVSSLVVSSEFITHLFKVNSRWLVHSRSWQSPLSDSRGSDQRDDVYLWKSKAVLGATYWGGGTVEPRALYNE